jgi:hypothetical protein
VALASAGTKATSSGEYAGGRSEKHRLEFLNDGQVGNSRSWISSTKGAGWVQLQLPQPTLIGRIVWGRDRNGEYDDRLPLAYSIEIGLDPERLNQVARRAGSRPAVHPWLNIERFVSVIARKLRMSIHKTTSLEPCIDELEVFTAEEQSRNIALAAAGTKVRVSSTYAGSPLHKLEHIHDGIYGNSGSWISAESGRGWIELELPEPVRIDTVRWGRDREGKFTDRLPLEYTIEVAAEDQWQVVATHHDRETYVPGRKFAGAVALTQLTPAEHSRAARLLEERARLDAAIKKLSDAPKVYAGVLTPFPAETRRFHRGDPMRPREVIAPGGLHAIGVSYALERAAEGQPQLTEDQRRRLALARWLVAGTRDFLKLLNERHLAQHPGDSQLAARIASYELAARMQLGAAEAGDLSKENQSVHRLYGTDDANGLKARFARNCLWRVGSWSGACGSCSCLTAVMRWEKAWGTGTAIRSCRSSTRCTPRFSISLARPCCAT